MRAKKRRYEPTRPGNPNKFTIKQHVHSEACVRRFANAEGRVGVWHLSNNRMDTIGPAAQIFCALRVWDQRLEHGKRTSSIETAFAKESEAIIKKGCVTDHEAVTAYFWLWQMRAEFRERPPDDLQLVGLDPASMLTKEEEENVEARHMAFARGDRIPGRFVASVDAMRRYDLHLRDHAGIRWGVLRATGKLRYICPDRPDNELAIPLTRVRALVAGCQDQEVGDETVTDLNRQSREHADGFIFGHPEDIRDLRATSQAGKPEAR